MLRVLKMIEEGKIDSEKGVMLIEALNDKKEETTSLQQTNIENNVLDPIVPNANGEKMLYVRVLSHEGDRVNVNLPMNFVKSIIAATGNIPVKAEALNGVDMEMLKQAIMSDISGRIVDIESHEGDKVLIEIV